jgi:anti-sigma B factor antagonist
VSLSEFAPKHLKLEERGDTAIVGLGLSLLTEDINLDQVGHELFALVEQFGCRKLVISLRNVRVVTSGGLGKLITIHRKMHRHEGTVIFCDLQPAVEEVLETSRLITYLKIARDVDAALAVLQPA